MNSRRGRQGFLALTSLLMILGITSATHAGLVQVSQDKYDNPNSQHQTQVEPDNFAFGDTIVSAFQTGRIFDGGCDNIGWATSSDRGATWQYGFMPGITKVEGGSYDRVSDASVAYDPKHKVWLVSSLALKGEGNDLNGSIIVSRSPDGVHWGKPVMVSEGRPGQFLDKNWTTCDTYPDSPYYGNCYTQWDDASTMTIYMSTSVDGGVTWGAPLASRDQAKGLGGQPVVQPNGTVIVPYGEVGRYGGTHISSIRSTDGGKTWQSRVQITSVSDHEVAHGQIRAEGFLPTAAVSEDGTVYVSWSDCRFRSKCTANDLVMVKTTDGVQWSSVLRIPLAVQTSEMDFFTPGLAAEGKKLALTFYYLKKADCSLDNCELYTGLTSSADGGATWSNPINLTEGSRIDWLAHTSQGYMFGDYISTVFSGGNIFPIFSYAKNPKGLDHDLRQSMHTIAKGFRMPGFYPRKPVTMSRHYNPNRNLRVRKHWFRTWR